ncbi:uncharacterized protein LOC131885191 [Tigriopus californicus]|uniref:uncharacterized protein LOC131885191 n=1 Tax=Tigriopus californicus TaxID=6832 RepID=UPI0027DA4BBB|nr:uncharacterized protein LOC131885191 [Tigriopus californicus]XP_059089127.1 uncharacterized protein LOC131885191 [Tigriopus californicus]
MSRDDFSSFTQLCGYLCLSSSNKEVHSTGTLLNVRKATPDYNHKSEKSQEVYAEEGTAIITEPLLSSSTDSSKRPHTDNSNQPSSNNHRGRRLERFHFRKHRPSFGERNQSTVLCCSPVPPGPGQVDLCPQTWFCSEYPEDPSQANQPSVPQTTEEHGGSLCQLQISDILWRALFFMTCLPLCYLCYFSRKMRRRRKITRAPNEQHTRNCHDLSRNPHSQVVTEGQDLMGQTILGQMKQIKSALKGTVNTNILTKPEQSESQEDKVVEGSEDTMRLPNGTPRPVEEDASPTKVIKINVIVLHSSSSYLIHKRLISTFGDPPRSPSLQGSQSDGMLRTHTAPAEGFATRSLLQVPGAKSSSVKRLGSLPSSFSTRHNGRQGQSMCIDTHDSRPTEPLVVANHHGGAISVHFSSQEKLSTVVEDEDPGEESALIPGTTESFTRRSSSSTSDQFYDCTDTISSLPTVLPEDGVQRPAIIISSSQNEEEVVIAGSFVPTTKKEHKPDHWKKVRTLSCFLGLSRASKGHISDDDDQTVQDGPSDPTQHQGRRVSTNLSEGNNSLELIGMPRNSAHVEHEAVQLRSGEKKRRSDSKSRSNSSPSSRFVSGASVKREKKNEGSRKKSLIKGRWSMGKSFSKIGPHIKEDLVKMESLGNRIELIKDLGFQVSFAVFDEASVSQWKGRDLQEAFDIPNMDLFLLAVRQNNVSELNEVLNTESGMISYLAKFWTGFYPLLLIEILNKNIDNAEEIEPFSRQLRRIHAYFGDVHHIRIAEDELDDHMDWIAECLGRLYIHARLFQCSRVYGDGLSSLDRCPGGCELNKRRTRSSQRLFRKPNLMKKHSRSAYGRTKFISDDISERI